MTQLTINPDEILNNDLFKQKVKNEIKKYNNQNIDYCKIKKALSIVILTIDLFPENIEQSFKIATKNLNPKEAVYFSDLIINLNENTIKEIESYINYKMASNY